MSLHTLVVNGAGASGIACAELVKAMGAASREHARGFYTPIVWDQVVDLYRELGAELYGVAHLGAIKSLANALSVFASALGPVILGILMDNDMSIEVGCSLFALYAGLALVLAVIALRLRAST